MANFNDNTVEHPTSGDPQELTSALADAPHSPTQSATEGDRVDSDREAQNPAPTVRVVYFRHRAFVLGVSNGRVDGSEDEYWHQAREQLQAAFQRAE
jgi:hypothetical protein